MGGKKKDAEAGMGLVAWRTHRAVSRGRDIKMAGGQDQTRTRGTL